jgi:cobalt-zinc-cadmium efflux system membrane fusion protein
VKPGESRIEAFFTRKEQKMIRTMLRATFAMAILAIGSLSLTGCSDRGAPPASAGKTTPDASGKQSPEAGSPEMASAKETDEHGHNLEGWWCSEHGVPEGECTRCDSSLIAGFKEKRDWCSEHDRPDSQCFECHPELEQKFAARYEAKFGKMPPKPTE